MQRIAQLRATTSLSALKTKVQSLVKSQRGGTFALLAITLPALIGMAGLGYDATIWYMTKRQIQTVADNAALSGVYTLRENPGDATKVDTAVKADTLRNNFDNDDSDKAVISNTPPNSGAYQGQAYAVEVIVTQTGDLYFASMFLPEDVTIAARAVASLVTTGGDHCLLTLNETAPAALNFTGNATTTANCGIASNSLAADSISVGGSAVVTAEPVQAVGGINVSGSGTLNHGSSPLQAHSQPLYDPYADTVWPTSDQINDTCDSWPNGKKNQTIDVDPGLYCGDQTIGNNDDFFLNPGVYLIRDGDLNVRGTITGVDVTIIFVGTNDANVGGIDKVNSSATVTLDAPGPDGHQNGDEWDDMYAGMLMMQQVGATNSPVNRFNGGATLSLEGAMYFPDSHMHFLGNSGVSPGCLQIVADTMTFQGNNDFNNAPGSCEAAGVEEISALEVRVLE